MQLSAQQRYATLQVMGTRLWVPRFNLPGAAASSGCDWPMPVKPPSARERLLEQQATPKKQHKTAPQPVVVSQPQVAAAVPQPVSMPAEPAIALPLVQVQPFHADIWLLANGWQLVMENVTGQPGLQAQDIKLLQNLLIALFPGGVGINGQQFFSWPLPGIPVEAGNEGELNMSLQAFLNGARFQGVQLAGCLVFGERLQGLMSKAGNTLRLFSAPTLAELQSNPIAKQVFWQQAGASGLRAAFASSPVIL